MEFCVKLLSLPLWERGLKFTWFIGGARKEPSLPLWERGLKSVQFEPLLYVMCRSPCGSVD